MELRVETTTEKTCQCHSMHQKRPCRQITYPELSKIETQQKKISFHERYASHHKLQYNQASARSSSNTKQGKSSSGYYVKSKAIYYYSNLVQRASSRSNSIHEWQQVRHQREICRIVARRTQQIEYRIKIVRTSERHATRNSHAAIIFYSCSACARRVSFWQRRCSEIFFLIHTSDGWLMMLFAQ